MSKSIRVPCPPFIGASNLPDLRFAYTMAKKFAALAQLARSK